MQFPQRALTFAVRNWIRGTSCRNVVAAAAAALLLAQPTDFVPEISERVSSLGENAGLSPGIERAMRGEMEMSDGCQG